MRLFRDERLHAGPAAAAVRVALAASMLLLAGCATRFQADVAVFHAWPGEAATPAVGSARNYAFAPAAGQRDSLEYRAYQDDVRRALAAHGLHEAAPAGLRVSFDYGTVDALRTVARAAPVIFPSLSVGYGWGGWRGGWGGFGLGIPLGGYPFAGPAYATVDEQEKVVEHRLRLVIASAADPAQRLYEATAIADAPTADLPQVFPLLVRAMFEDFPGRSGATRRVTVDAPAPR